MATINPTLVRFPIAPELQDGTKIDWREVEVKVEGPAQISELAIGEDAGKVFISFKATVVGGYKCVITHQDRALKHTPLTITVAPKLDDKPTPEVKLPDPVAPKSKIIHFKIPYKGVQQTGLSAFVFSGPDRFPLKSSVTKEGDQLDVMIEITKGGDYQVGVKGPYEEIEGSPFKITIPTDIFLPK